MHSNEDSFIKIKNGLKDADLRLYDERRQRVRIGSYFLFQNDAEPSDRIKVLVKDLHVFKDLSQIPKRITLKRMGYRDMKSFVRIVNRFYTQEEMEGYDFVVFEFELA